MRVTTRSRSFARQATDKKYLQISKAAPATRTEMNDGSVATEVTDPMIPNPVKQWRMNNCVDTFFVEKPFNKRKRAGLKKSANEFLDLWVEKTYLRTLRLFPCTQRRLHVVKTVRTFAGCHGAQQLPANPRPALVAHSPVRLPLAVVVVFAADGVVVTSSRKRYKSTPSRRLLKPW